MPGKPRVQKDGTKDMLPVFEDKFVFDASGCWLWTASLDSGGYAQVWTGTHLRRGHREMYRLLHGSIPPGVSDHLCRVRHCINPDHLEFITNRENILRGTGFSAVHAAKTHCPRGHEYDEENTFMYKTQRRCRECKRISDRERYARRTHG